MHFVINWGSFAVGAVLAIVALIICVGISSLLNKFIGHR